MNYSSPSEIKAVLKRLGIRLKSKWGQNFLINRGARQKIIGKISPTEKEVIWEVGPGLGCLTEVLLPRVKELVVFEIDRGLIRYLEEAFSDYHNFSLVSGDVIKTWKQNMDRGVPDKVVGNLPYSSASALIVSFIEAEFFPENMVFTVQRELARRMTARPGVKNYSSFSVLCQYAFFIRECFELKPGSFYPAPEVISTVIELKPKNVDEAPKDRKLFLLLVRALFGSRRKTLKNNLTGSRLLTGYSKELLLRAAELEGIDQCIRAEELQYKEFIRLSNRITDLFLTHV